MFRSSSLLLALGALACAGELTESESFLARGSLLPPPGSPTLDGGSDAGGCGPADVEALFRDSCGTVVCHGGPGTESGLDLTSPGVYGRLAGAPSQSCDGREIVGDDPAGSFFMEKVRGPVPADCGDPMPQIGSGLDAGELACLESWLVAEAAAVMDAPESEAP